MPVGKRAAWSASTSLTRWARALPAEEGPAASTGASDVDRFWTVSSTRVFHALHDVHRPTHRGKKAPHAWQVNWVVGFAIFDVRSSP
jgi:hypothetical protein